MTVGESLFHQFLQGIKLFPSPDVQFKKKDSSTLFNHILLKGKNGGKLVVQKKTGMKQIKHFNVFGNFDFIGKIDTTCPKMCMDHITITIFTFERLVGSFF